MSIGAFPYLVGALSIRNVSASHAPYSSDGGALDSKYAMDTTVAMTGAGSGPAWFPGTAPSAARTGDGCLNGTFLVTNEQQGTRYDLISFNYGIHDVAYGGASKKGSGGRSGTNYPEEWVPLPLYTENMRAIKRTLQATGAKVLFETTTPIPWNLTTNARIVAWNAAAKAVMAEEPAVPVNDLYSVITAICGNPPYNADKINYPNAPHCAIADPHDSPHYQTAGWEVLGNATAAAVLQLLAAPTGAGTARRRSKAFLAAASRAEAAIECNATALGLANATAPIQGHSFDGAPWRGAASDPAPTYCPANSTCMVTAFSNTGIGCCIGHGLRAVACGKHTHCCPEGWTCNSSCHLGHCGCSPP